MRHFKKGRKLHRKIGPRKALLKNLAASLILKEKIQTTEARAKETQVFLEKLITTAKKQNLPAFRKLKASLPQKAAEKLYYHLANQYNERKGGYTRIIKLGRYRIKDGASLVVIELVK